MIDDEATNRNKGPRFDDGLTVRQNVMGEEYVEKAFANSANTDSAALQDFVTDTVWGGVWTRPGLDHRSRSLLNLGILIALRAHEELAGHVRGALRTASPARRSPKPSFTQRDTAVRLPRWRRCGSCRRYSMPNWAPWCRRRTTIESND